LRFGDISYMERRYRGSIEYRDTYGGVGIVVPISGIAQHYSTTTPQLKKLCSGCGLEWLWLVV